MKTLLQSIPLTITDNFEPLITMYRDIVDNLSEEPDSVQYVGPVLTSKVWKRSGCTVWEDTTVNKSSWIMIGGQPVEESIPWFQKFKKQNAELEPYMIYSEINQSIKPHRDECFSLKSKMVKINYTIYTDSEADTTYLQCKDQIYSVPHRTGSAYIIDGLERHWADIHGLWQMLTIGFTNIDVDECLKKLKL